VWNVAVCRADIGGTPKGEIMLKNLKAKIVRSPEVTPEQRSPDGIDF
jgi:hypothetical protein